MAIALGIKAVEAGYPALFLTLEELTPAVGAGVKGESYRLKEKRRAGLLGGTGSPVPAEKEVEVQP